MTVFFFWLEEVVIFKKKLKVAVGVCYNLSVDFMWGTRKYQKVSPLLEGMFSNKAKFYADALRGVFARIY